jgi:hypothetical protein
LCSFRQATVPTTRLSLLPTTKKIFLKFNLVQVQSEPNLYIEGHFWFAKIWEVFFPIFKTVDKARSGYKKCSKSNKILVFLRKENFLSQSAHLNSH